MEILRKRGLKSKVNQQAVCKDDAKKAGNFGDYPAFLTWGFSCEPQNP